MVLKYMAIVDEGEEYEETGIVVAKNDEEARKKLEGIGFTEAHLKRLHGFRAFLKGLTADVK